jgi:hypothetical protein
MHFFRYDQTQAVSSGPLAPLAQFIVGAAEITRRRKKSVDCEPGPRILFLRRYGRGLTAFRNR